MSDYITGYLNTDGTRQTVTPSKPLPVTSGASGATADQVQGTAAGNAAAVGSPVQTGGIYELTSSTYDNNDAVPVHLDSRGNLKVALFAADATAGVGTQSTSADGVAGSSQALRSSSFNFVYNGATWDLARSVANGANTTGTGITAAGLMAQFDDVSPTAITENSFGNLRMSADHKLYVTNTPASSTGAGIVPSVSSAVSGGLVAKASAGNYYGVNCVAGASAGFLMVFNSTTVPADGAVTPFKCYPVAANGFIDIFHTVPDACSLGISVAFSTTGPFLKTASATAFISVDYA